MSNTKTTIIDAMNAYFDAKAGKTPDSNTKHTPEIAFSKLKQGATDWTDEYSVNILDDKARLVMKAEVNCYFDCEAAANNAKEIVHRYNTQPELLELASRIDSMKDDAYLVGHPEWSSIVENALAAIKKATE